MNRIVITTALAGFLVLSNTACHRSQPPKAAPARVEIYRFDDQLSSAATVSAPHSTASLQMAKPISWDFSTHQTDWELLRGRMGFRPGGELAVQGQGNTPVIMAPKKLQIDWSRYKTLLIRMIAEGGREIKIKIGDRVYKQKLGPPLKYKVYRFPLDITEHTYYWPLAVMPTNDLFATVAIDYIKLVPRATPFTKAAGLFPVGKKEEYRNTIYTYAPSSITYEVKIPTGGQLHFGVGIAEDKPVTFRVLAGPEAREVYSKTVDDPDVWEDATVDLAPYAGTNTKIVFETKTTEKGAVALWANPLLTTTKPKHRPNVLVYVECTLRPDHSSLYGYERDTTPFLKELGKSSVVFDDCQAQATWTKPSMASFFTSLYSFTHGIRKDTGTIPEGAVTMAQRLRAAGYVTASIIGNPFAGKVTGLDRGFDYMMEYPVVHRQTKMLVDGGTDSAGVNRVAFPWLDAHKDEPFFLFLLSSDPHAPYQPPKEFEKLFADPAQTAQFDRDYTKLRDMRGYGGGATISPAECRAKGIDPDTYHRRAVNRYDAEIAHNDHSMKLLADKLKQMGLLDNTLLVIASDHGEEFWEHGWSAHEHSLYNELVHVVLLMRHPKLLPEPKRVDEPVQLIDVLPTVADLLGIQLDGVVEGQTLLPLLEGKLFKRKNPVMSSRFPHPNFRPHGVPENRTGTFARFDRNWKFLYRDHAKRAGLKEVELYDRRVDRKDLHDVAGEHPELITRFRKELSAWIEEQKQIREMLGPRGSRALDAQTIDKLRSLGYIK